MGWRAVKIREYFTDLLIVFVVIAEAGVLWLAFFSENPVSFVIRMQQVITQKNYFSCIRSIIMLSHKSCAILQSNKDGKTWILTKTIRGCLITFEA